VSEAVNLTLAIFLSVRFGVLGLVWAYSLASITNMILLLMILRRKVGNLEDRKIIFSISKIAVAALSAGLIAQLAKYLVEPYVNLNTFFGVLVQLAASGGAGVVLYFLLSQFLRLEEFASVKRLFSRKFLRLRQTIPEDPTEASGI